MNVPGSELLSESEMAQLAQRLGEIEKSELARSSTGEQALEVRRGNGAEDEGRAA